MITDTIRAVDAGLKDMNVSVAIDGVNITITTPYEKIAIPQKEFEKLLSDFRAEKRAEPVKDEWKSKSEKGKNNVEGLG